MRRTCICILIAWIIVLQGIVYLYTNNMKKKIEHHVSVSSTSSSTTTTNEEIQPTNVIINQRTNLLRKEISPLQDHLPQLSTTTTNNKSFQSISERTSTNVSSILSTTIMKTTKVLPSTISSSKSPPPQKNTRKTQNIYVNIYCTYIYIKISRTKLTFT